MQNIALINDIYYLQTQAPTQQQQQNAVVQHSQQQQASTTDNNQQQSSSTNDEDLVGPHGFKPGSVLFDSCDRSEDPYKGGLKFVCFVAQFCRLCGTNHKNDDGLKKHFREVHPTVEPAR